jgi:hypothetical protein
VYVCSEVGHGPFENSDQQDTFFIFEIISSLTEILQK